MVGKNRPTDVNTFFIILSVCRFPDLFSVNGEAVRVFVLLQYSGLQLKQNAEMDQCYQQLQADASGTVSQIPGSGGKLSE